MGKILGKLLMECDGYLLKKNYLNCLSGLI